MTFEKYIKDLPVPEQFRLFVVIHNLIDLENSTDDPSIIKLPANYNHFPKSVDRVYAHDLYELGSLNEAVEYMEYDLRHEEITALIHLKRLGAVNSFDYVFTSGYKGNVNESNYKELSHYVVVVDQKRIEIAEIYATYLVEDRLMHKVSLEFMDIKNPALTLDGQTIKFKTMRDGNAFQIIDHCLNFYVNETVSLKKLKEDCNLVGVTNITETLRRTPFDKNGYLKNFVISSPSTIKVNKESEMSVRQFRTIETMIRIKNL